MKASFGIVGAGWRSEFFLRIARDLPEKFEASGIVVRNPDRRSELEAKWNVPVFATLHELLDATKSGFIVTSVPWAANLPILEDLASRNIPVLSETPIAPRLNDLRHVHGLVRNGARIQVAEQYLFQPLHAARIALTRSGRLGNISEAVVSVAHGYHGTSLLRHYLGTGLRLPTITARKFSSRIVAGPGRSGPPSEHRVVDSERFIAHMDFGDRLGIYDFTGDQYFSWIRSEHVQVRGEQGEINQMTVRYLRDFQTPVQFEITRRDTGKYGNLEGCSLDRLSGDGEVLYRNPFFGCRWSDDEIAVATSLLKMQTYVETDESFYGVAEACHDRYLDLLMGQAADEGRAVTAEPQPWTT